MENRLFLLQAPEVPSGLTANILADVDVTPEAEYSGKITLTQLNAYSGELKAEALTNFKTIKLEKDGSESFTNVAKLLLELQQGGGADDAREEADIAIASVEGDEAIKLEIQELSNLVNRYHDKYEAVALAGYDLAVATPESDVRWVSSQEADGVRTRFAAQDGMTFGQGIIAILNGVVVTEEDGSVIMSENGPYSIGFEFNVAPSVGDIVEFYVGMNIGKASRPYEDVNAQNQISEDAAILDFNAWEAARVAEIDAFDIAILDANDNKAKDEAEKAQIEADLAAARAAYDAAESVELINKFAEEIKAITDALGKVERSLSATNSLIDILTSKKADAQASHVAGEDERAKAAAEFAQSKSDNEAAITMFGAIEAESQAISA